MASAHPFTRQTAGFAAAPAAGSGTLNQFTYTVPSGKYARVVSIFIAVLDNGNAVNTTFASFAAVGQIIARKYNDAAGNNTLEPVVSYNPNLELQEGEQIIAQTTNTGAAAVTMILQLLVEEYP